MRIVSITEARKKLGELVAMVKYQKQPIALSKNGKVAALLVPYPRVSRKNRSMRI